MKGPVMVISSLPSPKPVPFLPVLSKSEAMWYTFGDGDLGTLWLEGRLLFGEIVFIAIA